MWRSVRAFIGLLLWSAVALAQLVAGHYVVELTGAPLGAEVRTKGRDGLRDRVAAIRSEQARVRALIEQRNGKMLSSLDSLMNALIVKIGDADASALSALQSLNMTESNLAITQNQVSTGLAVASELLAEANTILDDVIKPAAFNLGLIELIPGDKTE